MFWSRGDVSGDDVDDVWEQGGWCRGCFGTEGMLGGMMVGMVWSRGDVWGDDVEDGGCVGG